MATEETQEELQEEQSQQEEETTETSSETEAEDQQESQSESTAEEEEEKIPKQSYDKIRDKYKEEKRKRKELEKAQQSQSEESQQESEEQRKKEELYKSALKEQTINSIASKYNVKDPDVLSKLINTDQIDIDENGKVDTDDVEEEIKSLRESKPFLFEDEKPKNVGHSSGSAPEGGTGESGKIYRSQLTPEFIANNREKVHQAHKEGKIIDDTKE